MFLLAGMGSYRERDHPGMHGVLHGSVPEVKQIKAGLPVVFFLS